jgi:energy-coupling factor transport system permease protein
VRRALPLLVPLVLMCLLLWGLLTRGTVPLWSPGSLTVYRDSLLFAAAFAVRLSAMLIAGLAFVSATGIEELRLGLTRLGLPYPMAFAIGLAFRLVPLIGSTLEKAAQAQKSRGLALDRGGPLARLHNHAPLIIPVILVSLRNIDQLAAALEARGFGAQTRRTSFLNTPWRTADTACCISAIIVIAATITLKFL